MDAWSKMMIDLVNTDAYGQATGTVLDTWLTSSGPFRKVLEKVMTQVVSNFGMASRSDISNLSDRLTNIEMRLDDLDAKLDELLRAGRKAAPGPKAKPNTMEKEP
jgi:hypothetical protein